VGHSPDPDDAFMFHGIASGKVDTGRYQIEQVLEDIESLNRRALSGEIEVTAVSIHAFPHIADRYALMPCGASMGDGYGPIVVAREPLEAEALAGLTTAIPGTLTSAYLAMRLFVGGEFPHRVVPFDRILDEVREGRVDCGLVIHEGQLTWRDHGLHNVIDLGAWWTRRTNGLPLPLGGNAVRKDLGVETMADLTRILRESIRHALDHRDEALRYALDFGRGLDRRAADRFVGMYVNELTLDYGQRGREAIDRFLREGAGAGIVPSLDSVEFVAG